MSTAALMDAPASVALARPGAVRRVVLLGLLLNIGLVAFCALVFVTGLGLPVPLLGTWFGA